MCDAPGHEPGARTSAGGGAGFELPLLLFHGHPDVRPAYGFALQAVGRDGATASEIGRRLGVSKQAAGKTVEKLEGLGYVERVDDPRDGRRKLVRLTARGIDVLVRSAEGFDRLRAEWVRVLGADRVRAMEADLRAMAPASAFRLDAAGWFND